MEFVLKVKGVYTLSDIRQIDFVTFFKMLDECEQQQRDEVERLEAAKAGD